MSPIKDMVSVSVRGYNFRLRKQWLEENHPSKLSTMLLDAPTEVDDVEDVHKFKDDDGVYYLNRDPFVFSYVLDYYLKGRIHLTKDMCAVALNEELEFWGLGEDALAPCCRLRLSDQLDMVAGLKTYQSRYSEDRERMRLGHKVTDLTQAGEHKLSCRFKVWMELTDIGGSRTGKVYWGTVQTINFIFLLLLTLSSVPSCRLQVADRLNVLKLNSSSPFHTHLLNSETDDYVVLKKLLSTEATPALTFLLMFCIILLTIDFILRLCLSPSKRAFCRDALNVINMISLIVVWVGLGLGLYIMCLPTAASVELIFSYHVILQMFYLRVFYMFEAVRRYGPMRVVYLALKDSRKELMLLIILLSMTSIFYACLVYMTDIMHDRIATIPDGIWWAIITMTTVGYGDIVPSSTQGRVVGTLCAITGILCIALPVPIVAGNFSKYYQILQLADKLTDESAKDKPVEKENSECLELCDTNVKY